MPRALSFTCSSAAARSPTSRSPRRCFGSCAHSGRVWREQVEISLSLSWIYVMSGVSRASEAAWTTSDREVGRVAALWRYPVKSMAAEPLESVDVAWHGLVGDRRWAFFREDVSS